MTYSGTISGRKFSMDMSGKTKVTVPKAVSDLIG